jgi:uncharacterized protein (DUF58 family)
MAAAMARWRTWLLARAERRLPALTRLRQPESLPIQLHSRRIYIVPTRFGLLFALVVLAMLLGALNFNNNPALLLTFVVVSIAVLSFHHTVNNLRGLSLEGLRATPVHAGEVMAVEFLFAEDGSSERPALILEHAGHEVAFSLSPGSRQSVFMPMATQSRGRFHCGRVRLWTEYPFAIVWAWSWLHPDQSLLVYPRPEATAPPLPGQSSDAAGNQFRSPGEDWQGLREHHLGDTPKRIAWRASARADRLLVKEFADPINAALVLDYAELSSLEPEQRISRLTRWVLEARDRQLTFRLRLPGQAFGPGTGPDFVTQCLRALALLP